jgi:hypothetical protein
VAIKRTVIKVTLSPTDGDIFIKGLCGNKTDGIHVVLLTQTTVIGFLKESCGNNSDDDSLSLHKPP